MQGATAQPVSPERAAPLAKVLRGMEDASAKAVALLVFVCAGLGAAAPLAAQRELHTVRGVVTDTDGRPVQGAEVLLDSRKRAATTDAAGRFLLDSVPAGNRRLLVRRVGFLPVQPPVRVPQAPGDSLTVVLVAFAQQLDPIVVDVGKRGIYGVVGDTGYRALPGTVVELIGAARYVTTDSTGRFAFDDLKERQYMLRVSRAGYLARLLPVDLTGKGRELSVFLHEYRPGTMDWANSLEAAGALEDLGHRLALEPKRYRMTRDELVRYGTAALCDIPRIRSVVGQEANIIMRGTTWYRSASLCGWTAEQVDLLEWGSDPCKETWKSIADVLGIYCGANPARMLSLYATTPELRRPWVVVWPRN